MRVSAGALEAIGTTMAERAIAILSDKVLQRRLGRAVRALAEERFNVNRVVPMYRELYERFLVLRSS